MKPGKRDYKVCLLINGEELAQLKRHTGAMAEAFGLDSRIDRYQGKRPIGLYRWDMECLMDVAKLALEDRSEYPSEASPEYLALRSLSLRLEEVYAKAYDSSQGES